MAKQHLEAFVAEALRQGAAPEAVRERLAAAGWAPRHVQAALDAYDGVAFGAPVPKPQSYTLAREAFLYLILFFLLKFFALHLGALLFALLDLFIPAMNEQAGDIQSALGAVRWSTAATVVSFPLFMALALRIARERRERVDMQRSAVRKWLTYIALVGAAAVIVGDLASVVFNFLNGEITGRFLLKTLVVLGIAITILVYYLRDADQEEDRAEATAPHDRLAFRLGVAACVVVGLSVIAGFWAVGAPGAIRAERADERLARDLVALATLVDCRFTLEGELPDPARALTPMSEGDAEALQYPRSCTVAPGVSAAAAVAYRVVSGTAFELCADFERPTNRWLRRVRAREAAEHPGDRPALLNVHAAGRQCFTLQAERLALKQPAP